MFSNSHACRVKSVAPKSVSSQFGVRANDQIVRVGTRPILGSGRNNLINDWIKTDITRSQYGEAIVQFARPHLNQPNNPHIPATWRILYTMHQKCDTRNRIIFIGTKW